MSPPKRWLRLRRSFGSASNLRLLQSDIKEAEQVLGWSLPPSYKHYLRTFGWGELSSLFVIWPLHVLPAKSRQASARIQAAVELGRWPTKLVSRLHSLRLAPFGETSNGDTFAWAMSERSRGGERPIFILDRDCTEIARVAPDLFAFVSRSVLGGDLNQTFPRGSGEQWDLPHTFRAFSLKSPRLSTRTSMGPSPKPSRPAKTVTMDYEAFQKMVAKKKAAQAGRPLAQEKATKKKATKKRATKKKT